MATPFLKKIAYRLGYDLSFRRLPQYDTRRRALRVPRDMDPAFVDIYEKTRAYTMTSVERMYALYQGVGHVVRNRIAGDLVECGVWRGGSCMLIAHTLLALGESARRLYLYDTFAGMTEPEPVDVRFRDGAEQATRWELSQRGSHNAWAYAPLDEVKRNLASTGYPEDWIVYVEGEVERTLPAIVPDEIALLRLDTDWFASTYHELQHLYPRLRPGGIIILDDYGSFEGARKAVDQYLAENDIGLLLGRIDATGRMAVKPGPVA